MLLLLWFGVFLVMPNACKNSKARDQTQATVVTRTNPKVLDQRGNSVFLVFIPSPFTMIIYLCQWFHFIYLFYFFAVFNLFVRFVIEFAVVHISVILWSHFLFCCFSLLFNSIVLILLCLSYNIYMCILESFLLFLEFCYRLGYLLWLWSLFL